MRKLILIFLILFLFFLSALVSAAAINDHRFPIKMDRLTLKESLDNLGRIFGIDIVLLSNVAKLPQGRFNLDLEQETLENAIKEVMRKTNVQNHAMYMDRERNTLLVWILSPATSRAINNKSASSMLSANEMEPLTLEQMHLLAQKSQGLAELDEKPLTPRQMELLREQNSKLEAEMEESMKPLTQDQIKQLKEQSLLIEIEMEETQRPLSSEQMDQLRMQSFEIEFENEGFMQTLSKEQMLLLKEQEHKY